MLTLDQKSDNFTVILDTAADKRGRVFIADSGEDNWLETDTLFLENVSGWLIPLDRQREFALTDNRHDEKWDEFFVFAEWRQEDDNILIDFKKYPIYYNTAELQTRQKAV